MVVAVFYWKSCMKWISLQVMYAYYHDCDPMTTRQVNKKDQLFPLFVMQVTTYPPTQKGSSQTSQTTGDERLPWSARAFCCRRLLRCSLHRLQWPQLTGCCHP